MSMEGMGWILEIPDVWLLTWFLGFWRVLPCRRDCGLCRGLARLVVSRLALGYGCHRGGDRSGAGCGMGNGGKPNMSAKAWCRSCTSLVLVLWRGLSLPRSEMCSF